MRLVVLGVFVGLACAACSREKMIPLPPHAWIIGHGSFVVDYGYGGLGDVLCKPGNDGNQAQLGNDYSTRFLPRMGYQLPGPPKILVECSYGGHRFAGRRW